MVLQVSVIELQNSMVNTPEEGGLKEARYKQNNITIGDYAVCNMIPPHFKIIPAHYKVMCGCECFTSVKNMHSSLLTCCDYHLINLKDQIQNAQKRRSGEISSHILKPIRIL